MASWAELLPTRGRLSSKSAGFLMLTSSLFCRLQTNPARLQMWMSLSQLSCQTQSRSQGCTRPCAGTCGMDPVALPTHRAHALILTPGCAAEATHEISKSLLSSTWVVTLCTAGGDCRMGRRSPEQRDSLTSRATSGLSRTIPICSCAMTATLMLRCAPPSRL